MFKSLVVVDDFYPNPHAVRKTALQADYPEPEGEKRYPGRNSARKFPVQGMDSIVSQVAGERVEGIKHPGSPHTRFRITLAGEEGRYMAHVDPTPPLIVVGIVYLTLPEHCQGGTAFFRHRGLDSDTAPQTKEELESACGVEDIPSLLKKDGRDPEQWEHLMTVPMRFNRAVFYRPWLWHSAGPPFGDSIENGRLVQLLNFVPEGHPQ
jgi:hypothetical protein